MAQDKITLVFEPKTIRLEYNDFTLLGSTASFRASEVIAVASIARVTRHRQNADLLDVRYMDGSVEQFDASYFNAPYNTGQSIVDAISNAINNY